MTASATMEGRQTASEAYKSIRNWLLILKPGEYMVFDLPLLRLSPGTATNYVRRAGNDYGIQYSVRISAESEQILVRRPFVRS